MKVLKDGKNGDLKAWKAKVVCKKQDQYDENDGCGAELEVVESDLILMFWRGSHFPHFYCGVRCPQCGHCFKVKVPEPIMERHNTAAKQENAVFDGFSDEAH